MTLRPPAAGFARAAAAAVSWRGGHLTVSPTEAGLFGCVWCVCSHFMRPRSGPCGLEGSTIVMLS